MLQCFILCLVKSQTTQTRSLYSRYTGCSGLWALSSGKSSSRNPEIELNGYCFTFNSPIIGGTFSNPATKFPGLFNYELFRAFPYFLPCFFSALLAFLAAMFAYHFLEEVCHYPPSVPDIHLGSTSDSPK
jgi:hypothetical protein